jgi:hypothetical protein
MRRRHNPNREGVLKQEKERQSGRDRVIFVKADKRPWRVMKEAERWVLDVEHVEGAVHVQEEYIGHWRVTSDPKDRGRRPDFDAPVRYFYFIHQERPPGQEEWKYDPEKAGQF